MWYSAAQRCLVFIVAPMQLAGRLHASSVNQLINALYQIYLVSAMLVCKQKCRQILTSGRREKGQTGRGSRAKGKGSPLLKPVNRYAMYHLQRVQQHTTSRRTSTPMPDAAAASWQGVSVPIY